MEAICTILVYRPVKLSLVDSVNGLKMQQQPNLCCSSSRMSFCVRFLKILIVLSVVGRCLGEGEVHVYRYLSDDDSDNLISNDYYNFVSLPHSIFTRPTTFRPKPPPTPSRRPVYIRPTTKSPQAIGTTLSSTKSYEDTQDRMQVQYHHHQSSTTPEYGYKLRPEADRRDEDILSTTPPNVLGTRAHIETAKKGAVASGSRVQLEESPTAEVFLTRGNTEETVPLGLSKGGGVRDIIVSQDMVRNGSEFNHVVLLCNASYPVEWIYLGVGAPMLYTTQIRTFGNFQDTKTYGHSSIVVLVQDRMDERQTGTYVCLGIDKPNLHTAFHIYFKGEFGFPSGENVVVRVDKGDETVMVPCPTTDPTATIGLYRITSQNESKINSFTGSFAYDPRQGFSMKLSEMSNPYGTYACKFNTMDNDWKIEVVPPKDLEVQVVPNVTSIKMESGGDHTFICKGKEPVQMMLPNTANLGSVDYSENHEDEFPFNAVLTITPSIPLFSVAPYFKINCQTKKTRRVLHSWEYSNFESEVINVSYDKHHKRLLCCAKSGLTPIHEMAKCDTVTDCNIKKHCFNSGRCDYAFPPKFVDAPRGCTAIEFMNDFPSHVLKCSVGQSNHVMAMVSSNIDNDNLIIYDGSVPETEEILKIVLLKTQTEPTLKIEARCVASIFYFSTNIVFALEMIDGELIIVDEALIEDVNSYGPTLRAEVGGNVRNVFCFAPLTRSSDWRSVTLDLRNVTGILPYTDRNNADNENHSTTDDNINFQLMGQSSSDDDAGTGNYLDATVYNYGRKQRKRIATSVKKSTSTSTFLRKKQGQLIKVMQDI